MRGNDERGSVASFRRLVHRESPRRPRTEGTKGTKETLSVTRVGGTLNCLAWEW